MAKVIGPLFGLRASGSVADQLVWSHWKGVPYVRQHVVPANPNSAGQQAQRGYLSEAVANWHTTYSILSEKQAWGRWALYMTDAMSGFNKYVQENLNIRKTGKNYCYLHQVGVVSVTTTGADVYVGQRDGDSAMTVELWYGTSQGVMSKYGDMAWDATDGRYELSMSGLSPSTTYYLRFKGSKASPATDGWFGDVQFTTAAS